MRALACTAAIAAVAMLSVAGCGSGTDPSGNTEPPGGSVPSGVPRFGATATQPPTPTATTASGPARALPIYYLADTQAGPRLYREFHALPEFDDPATDALRELFANRTGMDPDYRSYWPAGAGLRTPVRHDNGVITVDVNPEAIKVRLEHPEGPLTIQQLVYTVQGALQSTDPVRLLVDGSPYTTVFSTFVSEPIERGDAHETRSLVQIDQPAYGADIARTFEVTGEAATFEANVGWQILRGGQVVKSGFATAQEGGRFSAYRFSVTLEPGDYTLRVVEDDPSGGAGRPPFEDTKLIHIH